jgi:hypothetical protein
MILVPPGSIRLEQVEEFRVPGPERRNDLLPEFVNIVLGGMDPMEENVLVFDRRWSLVVAGTAWFAALMCMLAYALTAR